MSIIDLSLTMPEILLQAVDPPRIISGILGVIRSVALALGAFAIAWSVMRELFNERRDFGKIILEIIAIIILVYFIFDPLGILQWVARTIGLPV